MRAYFLPLYGAAAGALIGFGFVGVEAGLGPDSWGIGIFAALYGAILGGIAGTAGALLAWLMRLNASMPRLPLALIVSAVVGGLAFLPELIGLPEGESPTVFGMVVVAVAGLGTLLVLSTSPQMLPSARATAT